MVFLEWILFLKVRFEMNGERLAIRSPKDALSNNISLVPEERKRNGLILIQDITFNVSVCIFDKLIKLGRLDSNKQMEILR